MEWIVARLKERSTWIGVVSAVTAAFSWTLDDVQREAVIQAGLALVTLLCVFVPDKKAEPPVEPPFPKPQVK